MVCWTLYSHISVVVRLTCMRNAMGQRRWLKTPGISPQQAHWYTLPFHAGACEVGARSSSQCGLGGTTLGHPFSRAWCVPEAPLFSYESFVRVLDCWMWACKLVWDFCVCWACCHFLYVLFWENMFALPRRLACNSFGLSTSRSREGVRIRASYVSYHIRPFTRRDRCSHKYCSRNTTRPISRK